jgi:hypothetical protein
LGKYRQKLYRPEVGDKSAYPHLQLILTRPINWDLIRQQYDQIIKYATALRLGTADPEAILRRFTKANVKHPTYQALGELGKVLKTIFLCQYLHDIELRREINEGLNVVENWNSANSFIFYGKSSEMATNQPGEQLLSVLSLHLLQVCLVYINTLMLQQVLLDPLWEKRLNKNDQRALTPLIYGHVNPYGTFRLELVNIRLSDLDFERCQIRINAGKGNKDRIVPFPIGFKEVLALHVDRLEQKQATYLFESSWKRKYSDRGVRKILAKYADMAGLDKSISPHQLRHFLLTWLKKQGIDDALIQPYSGHSSRQSLEVYSRLSIGEAQEVYDQVMGNFPV